MDTKKHTDDFTRRAMFLEACVLAKANRLFRRVLYTDRQDGGVQYVAMRLRGGEEIPWETHTDTFQELHLLKGKLLVDYEEPQGEVVSVKLSQKGRSVAVGLGTRHRVRNASEDEDALLVSVYSPPEHPVGLTQERP